jgi:heme-degrading monooxygenase HmoA
VIVEYVRYELPADRQRAFEDAYASVGHVIGDSPHCLGWEMHRGVEDPTHYVVRIQWTSRQAHETGFRSSPQFATFFAVVNEFVAYRKEMAHFEILLPAAVPV